MRKKVKQFITFIIMMFVLISLLSACSGNADLDATATKVPVSTTKQTPVITAEPSPTSTPEPTAPPYEAGSKKYAGTIVSSKPCYAYMEDYFVAAGANVFSAIEPDGGRLAVQFFATTSFTSVGFTLPTWGQTKGFTGTLKLFKWTQNYENTLKTTPIATRVLDGWNEASWEPEIILDTPVQDGEYLATVEVAVTTAEKDIGCWSVPAENPPIVCWFNNNIWFNTVVRWRIGYVETPENLHGPCSEEYFEG